MVIKINLKNKFKTIKNIYNENGVYDGSKTVKNIIKRKISKKFKQHNIPENKKNIFYVSPDICTNFYGFNYGKENFHPFVEQLKQLEINEDVELKNSIIDKFDKAWQNNNIGKIIMLGEKTDFYKYIPEHFKKKIPGSAIVKPLNFYREPDYYKNVKNYYYNMPFSIYNEDSHIIRLKELKKSIIQKGYTPEKFKDFGAYYIRGILLKKKEDYRFVVLGGRHRVAVLSYLDYEEIPVTFHDNKHEGLYFPQIIDYKNIENLPIVQMEIYPFELVQKMFDLYFLDDGNKKANLLGLI